MSASAGRRPGEAPPALQGVERAVGRALERLAALEGELDEARRRAVDLDRVLVRIAGGEIEPSEFIERLNGLEAENAELRRRIGEGRERVERLLARIRFLEDRGR